MQYLKLPIDNFKPTAGYKNNTYLKSFKYVHYGLDCISASGTTKLYALGDGVVKAAGLDGLNGKTTGTGSGCGFCLIIVYKDVYNHVTKKTCDVTCTYMHMKAKPLVKVGQTVNSNTLLGYYGMTGAMVTGSHLHIQIDTDTKYFKYCAGIGSKGHNLLKHGTVDSTIDPIEILNMDKGQKISTSSSSWYNRKDFLDIPTIPEVKEEAIEVKEEVEKLKKDQPKYENRVTLVK